MALTETQIQTILLGALDEFKERARGQQFNAKPVSPDCLMAARVAIGRMLAR